MKAYITEELLEDYRVLNIWFGKECGFQINRWEDEYTNPNYKESVPILVFCNHPDNPEDTEGNCHPKICPLKYKKER